MHQRLDIISDREYDFPRIVESVARNSPAVHQLFPSIGYFELGGRPFVEETFDANGDGTVSQTYGYSQMFSFFSARFPTVYSTNEAFHTYTGQDDWQSDTSGVDYHHFIGKRSVADTIDKLIATPILKSPSSNLRRELRLRTKKGIGDKTVPNLSGERCETEDCETGDDYNAPDADIIKCVAENKTEDAVCDHIGMVKAQSVRDEILNLLGLPFQNSFGEQIGRKSMIVKTRDKNGPTGAILPPVRQAYYLSVSGGERVSVTDESGNTNTPIGDAGFEIGVPGISFSGGIYEGDGSYQEVTMPAEEGEYSIKFRTGTDSIDIEIVKGIGSSSPNMAIRYVDLKLPSNVECLLTFGPTGVPDLRYDSNGDGTYDVVVPAHVRVSGAAAQDVTAPSLTVSQALHRFNAGLITINAVDTESGVKTVYYRFPGDPKFRIYNGPFAPDFSGGGTQLEAFADDNVGNRSSPIYAAVTNATPQ